MKRRIFAIFLAVAISIVFTANAFASNDTIQIKWLSTSGKPQAYFDELNWLLLYDEGTDNYNLIDLSTGTAVENANTFSAINEPFSEGLAVVSKRNASGELYGYIDTTGSVVIPLEYNEAHSFSEGLAPVAKKDSDGNIRWGYINKNGDNVVPFEYSDASSFNDGLALVAKRDLNGDSYYGYIDNTGAVIVPFEYKYNIYFGKEGENGFSEGMAVVTKLFETIGENYRTGYTKFGYIDSNGSVIVPLEYDYASFFSEGLAVVVKEDANGNSKYGFIDKAGSVVIPLEYDGEYEWNDFSEGLAPVSKVDAYGNYKYGFINQTGTVVIPFEYDGASAFSNGLAPVSKVDAYGNYKYGLIDKTGAVIIPIEYDRIYPFSDGVARVTKIDSSGNYKSGFIDQTGAIVIPLEYDGTSSFYGGIAWVSKSDINSNSKFGFIDKTGAIVIPLEYDNTGFVQAGSSQDGSYSFTLQEPSQYCWVKKGMSYGILKNPCFNGSSEDIEKNEAITLTTVIVIGLFAVIAGTVLVAIFVLKRKKQSAPKSDMFQK